MVEEAVIKEAKVWNSPADITEIKAKDKCCAHQQRLCLYNVILFL